VTSPVWPEPPEGFVLRHQGFTALYVAAAAQHDVAARGLAEWEVWDRELAGGLKVSGRGVTAVVDGGPHTRWRLKAMRRGGLLAGLWRDRYLSVGRLVETIRASAQARKRGVPTAAPIALIVETGAGGFARGAMAFEEIDGAVDLARTTVRGATTPADLAATIAVVRAMHDRGVLHPDLNLGNVLLRARDDGPPQVFLIDFDRATFAPGPLPFEARQAALRRLERSCAKLIGTPGPFGPGSEDLWYNLYAGDDAELARRLARGRHLGRLSLAMHRLGWRRNSP
jgi:hypothetical protein